MAWLGAAVDVQAQSDAVLARITTATDKKALKDCDIVVEVRGRLLALPLQILHIGNSESIAVAYRARGSHGETS